MRLNTYICIQLKPQSHEKYLVRLLENHKVRPEDIADGCLGYLENGTPIPYHYTRGESIKKARMCGGKIEELKTTPIAKMSLVTLSLNSLVYGIEKSLKGREAFKDATNVKERIFTADVFSTILKESDNLDHKTLTQLKELIVTMHNFDYVLITN